MRAGRKAASDAGSAVIMARCAERDALELLESPATLRAVWRACDAALRARVEQVRAVIALLSWGLS